MRRAVRLAAPGRAAPAALPAPPHGLQRKPEEGPLGEYLRKRETAPTVPPAGALSVHGEIADTLQAKSLPDAAARAARLGHRVGSTFTAVQRSHFESHGPGQSKATPSAVLADAFGPEERYRLKALSRRNAKLLSQEEKGEAEKQKGKEKEKEEIKEDEPDEEEGGSDVSLWLHGSELPKDKAVERAGKVKATIEGNRRLTGGRKSNPIQTLIGNLGEMERAILGRGPEKSYEGGHLIGDQFLDQESYVAWNLAPQARSLNNPYYKQVEAMLAVGPIGLKSQTADQEVPIEVEVEVTYPDDSYDVTVKQLADRKVITPSAAKSAKPETAFTFPRFVPSDWSLKATIPSKFQASHGFPSTELTEAMKKVTGKRTLLRVPSQEHIATPTPLSTVSEDRLRLGGGAALTLSAQQHYPDPQTPAKGTKLTLDALLAPPKHETRLRKPVNLLDPSDRETLLDDLGELSSILGEEERDPVAWSAIAYYITEAVRSGAKDRNALIEAAVRAFQKPLKSLVQGSVKDERVERVRLRLRQILLYDAFVKLSEKEKLAAADYEEVEQLGAAFYQEEDSGGEEEEFEEVSDEETVEPAEKSKKRKEISEDTEKAEEEEGQVRKLAKREIEVKTGQL